MTRHGYTHITLVCDRSGSMSVVRTDAEGAVNTFITEQKAVSGEATLTLIEFDARTAPSDDSWYHTVHNGDIKLAPVYHLRPRGSTALLDATAIAINKTGEALGALPEHERPEHVVFVVQTDGQENSSREYSLESLQRLIKEQTEVYGWHFLFLGMGPDTFAQGHQMGFANVTQSAHTGDAYVASYTVASDNVRGLRTNAVANLAGTNVKVDEEGTVKQS